MILVIFDAVRKKTAFDFIRIALLAIILLTLLTTTVSAQTEQDPVFRVDRLAVLVFMAVFSLAVLLYTHWARKGRKLFIRKIPGIAAIEEAVGRATEMGKPVLFIPGISDVEDIETIAGLSILGRVARITAQ
jgi:hypothetical protein